MTRSCRQNLPVPCDPVLLKKKRKWGFRVLFAASFFQSIAGPHQDLLVPLVLMVLLNNWIFLLWAILSWALLVPILFELVCLWTGSPMWHPGLCHYRCAIIIKDEPLLRIGISGHVLSSWCSEPNDPCSAA